jgi:pyrroloquinoline-quinone synthase
MTGQQVLQERIGKAVSEYAMLNHPFYQLWTEGKLTQATLAEYAKQYYAHVAAFPVYVSSVHSRCDDISVRQLLLENLIEEERGPENHPELWLRFAEGLGVNRDEVHNVELLASTKDTVARLKSLTASADYRLGVAALYAYESQIPEVAKIKRAGLKVFYGVEDARTVSFFTAHEGADLVHRQIEMKILSDHCDTNEVCEETIDAARAAARSLWDFLTGIHDTYVC